MRSKIINPITIVGLLLSLATGFIFWRFQGPDYKLAVTNALLLFLIILVLNSVYQIVSEIRIQQDILTTGINKQHQITTELLSINNLLSKDDKIRSDLGKIAKALVKIHSADLHPIFQKRAQDNLDRFAYSLSKIASGEVAETIGNDWPLYAVVDEAHTSLKSISLVSTAWWLSEIGQRYIEKLDQAIIRGVKTSRIFIIKDNEDDEDLKNIASIMYDKGVHVMMVRESNLPKELHIGYIICDETLVQITEYDFNKYPKYHTFSCNPQTVLKAIEDFDKATRRTIDFVPLDN